MGVDYVKCPHLSLLIKERLFTLRIKVRHGLSRVEPRDCVSIGVPFYFQKEEMKDEII